MSNFKVGDKVRVVERAQYSGALREGEIHTVKAVKNAFVYVGTIPDGWFDSRFELVVPTFEKGARVVRTGPHTLAGGGTNFGDTECKMGDVGTIDEDVSEGWSAHVTWDKGPRSAIDPASLALYVEPVKADPKTTPVKVGDRVQIVAPHMERFRGRFGTVEGIDAPHWPFSIRVDTIGGLYYRHEFVVVEPEPIKKPKFKVGDRVVVTEACAYGYTKWGKFGTVTNVYPASNSYPICIRLDDETYYDGSLYTESEIRLVEIKTTKKKAIQVQAHIEGGYTPVLRAEEVQELFTEFLSAKGYKIRGKVTTDIYEYTQKTEA